MAGDAGLGYDIFLSTIYQLDAKRVVDLRNHQTDRDKVGWTMRGYDNKGRPACPFGYSFTTNGFDTQRQRRKWCCNQACLKDAPPSSLLKKSLVRRPNALSSPLTDLTARSSMSPNTFLMVPAVSSAMFLLERLPGNDSTIAPATPSKAATPFLNTGGSNVYPFSARTGARLSSFRPMSGSI